jgi:trk system potassium uptake protein TrkA
MKAFSELNIDELPVVNNDSERIFIGTISKNDVIEIYNNEMLKRDTVSSVSSYISSLHKLKQVQLIDGQVLSEIEIPSEFINKTLKELNLRNRFGVEVVLIKQKSKKEKDEKDIVLPTPDFRFQSGDSILILGSLGGLKNFTQNEPE